MNVEHDCITGLYVRAFKDGKWQSIDIALLSEREIEEFFKDATKERVVAFVAALAGWAKDTADAERP